LSKPLSTSKPPEKSYHHGDLRRTLLEAALNLINEQQDWNFSLREVARRAGVSHNAHIHHFADKHDLLLAVAAEGYRQLHQCLVDRITRPNDPEKSVIQTAQAYVRFGLEHPALYRLMFGSVLVPTAQYRPPDLQLAAEKAKSILKNIIALGLEQGTFRTSSRKTDVERMTLVAWSQVHGLTTLLMDGLHFDSSMKIDDLVEHSSRVLLHGLSSKV
jgi:AcrR family transcriptional regulator